VGYNSTKEMNKPEWVKQVGINAMGLVGHCLNWDDYDKKSEFVSDLIKRINGILNAAETCNGGAPTEKLLDMKVLECSIWCHYHGCVHENCRDPYAMSEDCREHHIPLFVIEKEFDG